MSNIEIIGGIILAALALGSPLWFTAIALSTANMLGIDLGNSDNPSNMYPIIRGADEEKEGE